MAKGASAGAEMLLQAQALREHLHGRRLQILQGELLRMAIEQQLTVALPNLHLHFGPYPLFRQGRDQHTELHRLFYAAHRHLVPLYASLCEEVVSDVIDEPCYVQQIPTYRFGLPGNRWVGSFHHDSDFGHPPFELNAVLALTPMQGSAALHVEDAAGSYRYSPLTLDAGELVLFNHIDRRHGCCRNREGVSVSSIDFRFVPVRFADAAFQGEQRSLNTRVVMVTGGYFSAEPMGSR